MTIPESDKYNQGILDGATKVFNLLEYLVTYTNYFPMELYDIIHETIYLAPNEFTFDTEFDVDYLNGRLSEGKDAWFDSI